MVEPFTAADRLGTVENPIDDAGVVDPPAQVPEMSAARLHRMMATGGRGGAIVNVSSIAARLGGAGQFADYAASKGVIDSLTVGLAREVADRGIRVDAVAPGIIETGIHASGGTPDKAVVMGSTASMKRAGTPEEVAAPILRLLSMEAACTTGAILDVSGGRRTPAPNSFTARQAKSGTNIKFRTNMQERAHP